MAHRGKHKLVVADCEQYLADDRRRYDLIFADPPFNINHGYRGFKDKKSKLEFIRFTHAWLRLCWSRLAPQGVLCLHGPDFLAKQYVLWEMDNRLSEHAIAWCNWHYRFGQCNDSNWIDSRCHLMVYAKCPDNFTWNPDDVLVDSDRATKYGDRRTEATSRPGKRLPLTVWGVESDGPFWGRVQGNSRERRTGHPNQLPEVYLERIIRAYTNEKDRVLDPFCGSGTTPTVAVALGRDCVAIDVSPESIASARQRVKEGPVRVK